MKISTSGAKLRKSSIAERFTPFETRQQDGNTLIPNMTATER